MLIGSLVAEEIGICDNFLPAGLALALRQNLVRLDRGEQLRYAGVGNNVANAENQKMRGDKIFWIDNDSTEQAEAEFLTLIRAFILYLNESCYTRINAFEFHYALYETGSFYRRHLDQFKTNSDRKFSMVSYLNTGWLPEDGGELCIYSPGVTKKIIPQINKSVLFRSDEMEHEVLPATRPRMSITGWLKSV